MDKRIKALYIFTISAILAVSTMHCWWLCKQYKYTYTNYADKLYNRVIGVMEQEFDIRRNSGKINNISLVTNSQIKARSGNQGNHLVWVFDIYAADENKYPIKDSCDSKSIVSLYNSERHPDGIIKYHFEVENQNNEHDVYKALSRFQADLLNPFSLKQLAELLKKEKIYVTRMDIEQRDTMVWAPEAIFSPSFFNPRMEIAYPYDNLEGQLVRIDFKISVSPIIKEMSLTLMATFLVTIILASCLVAQIKTIRRMRKIEFLRKEFINTMIHELKRPISTLKMCVSFMKNDKLMQDTESKNAIISDSYNELDNLSSYFAKLRDMTFDEISEIPLTFSSFSLHQTINDCIAKLNLPGDKTVNFKITGDQDVFITADRMHLSNIISNLLENSIKYSKKVVNIEIGYQITEKAIVINVTDDGIGIPVSDIKYIFDKFYRSRKILNDDIPGLGLGLSYVKLLIEAHNGKVQVQSEEGRGSTFIITIPQNKTTL